MQLLVKMFIKENISVFFFYYFWSLLCVIFNPYGVNCKCKCLTGLKDKKRKSVLD